jgi:membrane associated rhomboid family serine protease
MGIYDRQYYREDEGSGWLGGRTMVVNLILLNVVVYIAELLFAPTDGGRSRLVEWFALRPDLLTHPWCFYQLLSYGFLHDSRDIFHLIWNMIALWFFGREVEGIYGPMEFLRVYLTILVMSGLAWVVSSYAGPPDALGLVGASGGVMGIAMIFTLHFPTRPIYVWGIFPVPVWALMAMYVFGDFMGTANRHPDDVVAHVAHLGGALFGFIYYRSGWNLGKMLPERWPRLMRPRLKLHNPEPPPEPRDLSRQVDEILAKITREGESSLTTPERRILEEASRRYQRRRQ